MKFFEVNFNAGRKPDTFRFHDLGHLEFSAFGVVESLEITRRYRVIQYIFHNILEINKKIKSVKFDARDEYFPDARFSDSPFDLSLFDKIKSAEEEFILRIKILIDFMCQCASKKLSNNKTIIIDDISKTIDKNEYKMDHKKCIIKLLKINTDNKLSFIEIITNCSNSIKHHLFKTENSQLIGDEWPTIIIFYRRNSTNKNECIFYNLNAFHVMMGLQDFISGAKIGLMENDSGV